MYNVYPKGCTTDDAVPALSELEVLIDDPVSATSETGKIDISAAVDKDAI